MTAPKRVQRRRTAGWRKPEGAVSVARPGRWGNPFASRIKTGGASSHTQTGEHGLATMTRQLLVDDFRRWITMPVTKWPDRPAFGVGGTDRTSWLGVPYEGRPTLDEIRAELAGKDLMCWCPLDQPCHADVLLDLANTPEGLPS